MKKIGLHVYGDVDSPIIPVMVYFPAKLAAFSRFVYHLYAVLRYSCDLNVCVDVLT